VSVTFRNKMDCFAGGKGVVNQ